ncbi:hypothetical protein CC80DRAFT_42389 [Byssothecium circinans]|uniref:Uncharacterized protein n=1 Tax=Byssothecium circinans TaxID=147558 RepID=A0A6A5U2W7_9PLEO|nr:hypothetical protein CC80DRAFT_42389 [Byssothecium circinans]
MYVLAVFDAQTPHVFYPPAYHTGTYGLLRAHSGVQIQCKHDCITRGHSAETNNEELLRITNGYREEAKNNSSVLMLLSQAIYHLCRGGYQTLRSQLRFDPSSFNSFHCGSRLQQKIHSIRPHGLESFSALQGSSATDYRDTCPRLSISA